MLQKHCSRAARLHKSCIDPEGDPIQWCCQHISVDKDVAIDLKMQMESVELLLVCEERLSNKKGGVYRFDLQMMRSCKPRAYHAVLHMCSVSSFQHLPSKQAYLRYNGGEAVAAVDKRHCLCPCSSGTTEVLHIIKE